MHPIWFILGPSGSGKSFLSKKIADRQNWLFYEIDQHPKDGIDEAQLRNEWDDYYRRNLPDPLFQTLLTRMKDAQKRGVILSFPSTLVLKGRGLQVLEGKVHVIYFSGTEGQCLDVFLDRERRTGRNLDATHWAQNNRTIFDFLSTEEGARYSMPVFDGKYRWRDYNTLEHHILNVS